MLLFAMLAFRFGHGLYFPFSSIYFHNVLGIPLSLVGVGLAVFAACGVLSGLVSGPLIDRYGRKPVMLAALVGSSAGFFGFSQVGGFAGYLAVSAAHGLVGWSMFEASRNAMVLEVAGASLAAELAPARLRGTYLALFGSCFGVAIIPSPIIAGALLEAGLPGAIWSIQLAAAALAAVGLGTMAVLRRSGRGA